MFPCHASQKCSEWGTPFQKTAYSLLKLIHCHSLKEGKVERWQSQTSPALLWRWKVARMQMRISLSREMSSKRNGNQIRHDRSLDIFISRHNWTKQWIALLPALTERELNDCLFHGPVPPSSKIDLQEAGSSPIKVTKGRLNVEEQ